MADLAPFEINNLVARIARASQSGLPIVLSVREIAFVEAHPMRSGLPAVQPTRPRDETQGLMIASRMMETSR